MNDISINAFQDFVMLAGDKLVTDSRRVANKFGKRHNHIMRDIRDLLKQVDREFAESNFGFCTENNGLQNGKPQPFYQITKDGFMLLVMGFTGAKAMAMKVEFIKAFNWMAKWIKENHMALWEQKIAVIIGEANSKAKGSYGSHLMLDRKREKPKFRKENERLDSLMHPSLPFLFH